MTKLPLSKKHNMLLSQIMMSFEIQKNRERSAETREENKEKIMKG